MSKLIFAYEIDTHAKMTQETIPRTVLADNVFLQSLGLSDFSNDYGLTYFDYYDSINGEIQIRNHYYIENDIFIQPSIRQAPNTLKGWFMRGVIREDDCAFPFVCSWAFDDPVNANRPFNHFFDPLNNTALFDSDETAPNWALGTKNAFQAPAMVPIADDDVNYIKYNHYTIFDAQEAMARALSGQYIDNTSTVVKLDAAQRKAYWATTFRTLGNVVHLIQDMGQPQHTRDDAHSKINTHEQQVYEAFTNARTLNTEYTCIYGNTIDRDKIAPLNFKLEDSTVYPVPTFKRYSDFFSTQLYSQDGKGLADYSNREFFSAGTNKGDQRYPSPDNKIDLVETKDKFTSSCMTEFAAEFTILTASVNDQNDNSKSTVIPLTARSVWDRNDPNIWDINDPQNTFPKYALTQKNYIAMADNLIPRAVAYGAGLINHFFRGRLDITKIEQTVDSLSNAVLVITVKNISAQNFAMSNGKFEIFYDAIVNGVEVRKPAQLSVDTTGDVVSLLNGNEQIIKILIPTDIDTTKENPFVVVFKGNIGIDPGIAGKVFNTKGETAILLFYTNNNELLVKRSIDRGLSWNVVNDPAFTGFDLFNGSSKGTKHLPSGKGKSLLVGRYGSNNVTLRSTNNGENWLVHLDQSFGEYTEVLNVAKAVHVGNGRLVSFNNYYSSSYTVGLNTYHNYTVELSESFDDGQTWSPMNIPFEVNGRASHLYYLGNQHMYLLTSGYDVGCNCTKRVWYESFNAGESFAPASFTIADLEWNHGQWYRDAYAHDTGQIITTKQVSPNLSSLIFNYATSNDGGKILTITDTVAKEAAWPQAEPIHIRPLGQGVFVSYVFDPWTAYEKNLDNYYEGILISEDYGKTWKQVYQNILPTWFDPYYNFMGVTTDDPVVLKYIH